MVNIALIGLGTVGTGVLEILTKERQRIKENTGCEFNIKKILVKDIRKKRDHNIDPGVLTENPDDIFKDNGIGIVVELSSGNEDIAAKHMLLALENNKHVVTAGKAAVAKHWDALCETAAKHRRFLLFEGAVGGVIPVMELFDYLSSNEVSEIIGIINGTTNYILTRMEEGMEYEKALALAQEKGYAEVPPDLDVLGFDSASKISLLASRSFQTRVDPSKVYTEGITAITQADFRFAKDKGYAIKLIASARNSGQHVHVSVYPAFTKDPILSNVKEAMNAIKVIGSYSGPITIVGQGAGRYPTATAVVHDILCIASGADSALRWKEKGIRVNEKDFPSKGYFRIHLSHRPGSLSIASGIIGDCGISIEETAQYKDMLDTSTNCMPWFFVTEPTAQSNIEKVMAALGKCDRVVGKPMYMRVLD